jgi:adenylate cyclase, class 2
MPPRAALRTEPAMEINNIEIKARCGDLDQAHSVCREIGARFETIEEQDDTFYPIPRGRLKLRRSSTLGAQLIFYIRPDQAAARASEGERIPVSDPEALHGILEMSLGVWARIKKTRHVYWLDNIKIHLDHVEGLGTFIEFEAVLSEIPDSDRDTGRETRRIFELMQRFGLKQEDLIAHAYADMPIGENIVKPKRMNQH